MKKRNLLLALTLLLTGCNKQGEVCTFKTQLDSLTQLNNGTVDVAIIDSVMAGYYTSTGKYKDSLKIVDNIELTVEQYGIAAKKGNVSLINKINEGLVGIKNTKLKDVANYFGISSSLAIDTNTTYNEVSTTDTAWADIVQDKTIVIGYTVFAPIAYTVSEGTTYGSQNFTGFDIELAREVINYLDPTITIDFQEIDWNSKETLLSNGTIDLVWNGLTITDERKESMEISIPYLNNKQVVVVKKEDLNKYTTKDSLSKAIIGVESGSAGEDVAKSVISK